MKGMAICIERMEKQFEINQSLFNFFDCDNKMQNEEAVRGGCGCSFAREHDRSCSGVCEETRKT